MKKIYVAVVSVFMGLSVGPVWAKEDASPVKRTLSFSSGYLTNSSGLTYANSNRALSNFYDEIGMAYGAGFDAVADTGWGSRNRGWLALLNLIPNSIVTYVQGTGYHEFGHYSRFKAYGYSPVFANDRYASQDPRRRTEGFKNPFTYTLYLFTRPGAGAATYQGKPLWFAKGALLDGVDEATQQAMENALRTGGYAGLEAYMIANAGNPSVVNAVRNQVDKGIIISAAGVNNAMRLSGDLVDRARRGDGHITDTFMYIDGRLQSLMYPSEEGEPNASAGNDMDSLVASYRLKEFSIRKSDFNTANTIALFCSSSTYAYMLGWYHFVDNGNTRVTPFTWGGVYAPDVEAYLLAEGISYKIKTGYAVNDVLSFPVSVEFVSKGKKGAEASVGACYRFEALGNIELSGNVLFGRKLGGDVRVHVPVDRFFVEGVVESMHQKSFYGQRNIPTLKKSVRSTAFLVRAGITY
ncbi:hypothetical protein EIL50_04360 [bacterium NHP-B]|nr:hypothetical protein EIL50_04360 [bacterium NHP-B]